MFRSLFDRLRRSPRDQVPSATLRYRSPLELPNVELSEIGAVRRGIWLPDGPSDRWLYRGMPAFLDDPACTGTLRRLRPVAYTLPPRAIYSIADAEVTGFRAVIDGDRFGTDEIVADDIRLSVKLAALALPDTHSNEATGLAPTGLWGEFHRTAEPRPTRHLTGPHVFLGSHEPDNYGSFLFRVLSKLTLLQGTPFYDLPMVVPQRYESFVRLLELAGVETSRLVVHEPGTVTTTDRAIIPVLPTPHGFLDRQAHSLFQAMAAKVASGQTGRRLYVSRMAHTQAGGSTRVMLNEGELIGALAEIGIEAISPEAMTVEEQVRAFAAADLVVGPSGSGMFNTVFCRSGTRVIDIESEAGWIFAHTGLFASSRLDYGVVVGKCDPADTRPVHRQWEVDVEKVVERAKAAIG